jgi:hypothetical protein
MCKGNMLEREVAYARRSRWFGKDDSDMKRYKRVDRGSAYRCD